MDDAGLTVASPEMVHESANTSEDGMAALQALVGADLARVNDLIMNRMDSRVALIPKLAGHIVSSGGKRLRPMLTLAAAEMCGYAGGERHILLATCVEFIHTATLLHDDVVDQSALRRGRATANAVWGNASSVLVGDFLFSRAFQLMVQDGSLKVLEILSHASAVIAEGEVMQLGAQKNLSVEESVYWAVVTAKTAALFAAAAEVGGVVAGRPEAETRALHQYGENLGIAFQLVDDALDYSAAQARLGKTVGDDFHDGKVTLPVLLAFHRGDAEEKTFWKRCIEQGKIGEGDLDHALLLMRRHHTLDETFERAREYGMRARQQLAIFPDSPVKSALDRVIDFCVEREY